MSGSYRTLDELLVRVPGRRTAPDRQVEAAIEELVTTASTARGVDSPSAAATTGAAVGLRDLRETSGVRSTAIVDLPASPSPLWNESRLPCERDASRRIALVLTIGNMHRSDRGGVRSRTGADVSFDGVVHGHRHCVPCECGHIEQILVPPTVQRGDLVRLVSPASWPDVAWLRESIAILEGWGLRVDVGAHALDRHGYCAGRDEDRLADLNEAFADPEVRCIVTTRGGAGAYRIADFVDFDSVRADPKPLVGFSDITHLHLALWHHCRLGAIHGALAGSAAQASVRQLLMTRDPLTAHKHDDAVSAAVSVSGKATGWLVGGNLTAIATSVGSRLPRLDGAILFLEDLRHKGLGFVDRLLTQLIRSGSLEGVVGIALGSFEGFRDVIDRGWTIVDVLEDRLGNLGVPILGGLFAGHDLIAPDGTTDQLALPLGATAHLDADAGTISFAAGLG